MSKFWNTFNPPVDGKQIPARKAVPVIIAVSAFIAVAAACSSESEPVAVETYAPIVAQETAPPVVTKAQTAEVNESNFYRYVYRENIPLNNTEARNVAQAACSTLRKQTDPDSGMVDVTLYGIGIAVTEKYPDVTMDDSARLIGAGSVIWCPEYTDSFGDSSR